MNILIKTKNDLKIELQHIRQMSETDDGLLLFLPKYGNSVSFIIDGKTIMYSEAPSIDRRLIHSIDIAI